LTRQVRKILDKLKLLIASMLLFVYFHLFAFLQFLAGQLRLPPDLRLPDGVCGCVWQYLNALEIDVGVDGEADTFSLTR
jgi:hypothetical protein